MTNAIIFDMDGTLVNVDGIRHYVEGDRKTRNFDKFHRASLFCPPNDWVLDLAHHYCDSQFWANTAVLIVTAREQTYEQVTKDWLYKHRVAFDALYMREPRDYRPDNVVKQEMLDRINADGYDVLMAFEDREDVALVWEANGIEVVHVNTYIPSAG